MSTITGLVDHKRPSHRRNNNSGELDVFEAAQYFSGYNDNFALVGGTNLTHKMMVKEERQGYLRGGRVSLDLPTTLRNYQLYHHPHNQPMADQLKQQKQPIKDKKFKQPSSPGGKLAHFLNSLFNQTTSKKNKSSKSSTQSMKDEDESSSGRRKRSSISHFRSTSSVIDSKSIYSSSSSGFRTPPSYVNTYNTPIKSYKDFRSFSDRKQVLANNVKYNKIQGSNFDFVDEKLKLRNGFLEKSKNFNHGYQEKEREIKKFDQGLDDGEESDSSSDLFELQIDYQFGYCSSGLPVYETTRMDSIKRSSATAITNGPIRN